MQNEGICGRGGYKEKVLKKIEFEIIQIIDYYFFACNESIFQDAYSNLLFETENLGG